MDLYYYDIFKKYDCKYINELFAKNEIYKIGVNVELDTLCNIDGLNDISVLCREKGYHSSQKYCADYDSLENLNYNKILLTFNSDNIIKASALIEFDFNNDIVFVNGKSFKIEKDYKYAYRIMKTKIKVHKGIIGFYYFCLTLLDKDSPFLLSFINTLNELKK